MGFRYESCPSKWSQLSTKTNGQQAESDLPNQYAQRSERPIVDEFAKGMIVEFGLKSYQMSSENKAFLARLKDPREQDAVICVYSQDYLAASFRVGGWLDRLKSRWNSVAFRFNNLFTRRVGKRKDAIRMYEVLPRFKTFEQHIKDFVNWTLREEVSDTKMDRSA